MPSNRVSADPRPSRFDAGFNYFTHLHPAHCTPNLSSIWSKQSEVRIRTCATSRSALTDIGTLVKCDASIKAMLVDIDSKNGNEYIIEELDEEHILVKETKVHELKSRLNMVSIARKMEAPVLTIHR